MKTPKIFGRLFVLKERFNILTPLFQLKSIKCAIDVLRFEKGEGIVLGDMFELGLNARDFHDESIIKMNESALIDYYIASLSAKSSPF